MPNTNNSTIPLPSTSNHDYAGGLSFESNSILEHLFVIHPAEFADTEMAQFILCTASCFYMRTTRTNTNTIQLGRTESCPESEVCVEQGVEATIIRYEMLLHSSSTEVLWMWPTQLLYTQRACKCELLRIHQSKTGFCYRNHANTMRILQL